MNFSANILSRFQLYLWLYFLFCLFSLVTRVALLFWNSVSVDFSLNSVSAMFAIGWLYDTAFYLYASIPLVFILWLTPEKLWHKKFFQWLMLFWVFVSIYILTFVVVSEFIFWDEFQVRFNFISVDYLVYRKEVLDNIQESYPVLTIVMALLPVSLLIAVLFHKVINNALKVHSSFWQRSIPAISLLIMTLLVFTGVSQSQRSVFTNNFNKELASNGPYQFFSAFRNNELEYTEFYQQIDNKKADKIIREALQTDNSYYLYPEQLFNIGRHINNPGKEKTLNVVLISIESLSAKYLGSFGNTDNITPFMDELAKESLFFTHFYATGTRTTRGLEAITLSIPPTPGRSIVKRIGQEADMWSLGNVLRSKGYQTTFLYGGRGYFDNMNSFFSKNGYDVLDQTDIPENEVKFANAWGVSDEDLYEEALKQADKAYERKKPFFFHLMTTSNHRPYTYPENKIDIPSGDGRDGAVKYTDFAIKRFINSSKNKAWFKDTIFVILADHSAGSAGRENLPIEKYHIPLWIYSPNHIKPKIIAKRAGQIDVAPTVLALLNMDYDSWFFGKNMMTPVNSQAQDSDIALIGNYQYLGLYQNDILSILKPKKQTEQYKSVMKIQLNKKASSSIDQFGFDNDNVGLIEKTIAYYQTAAYLLKNRINAWSVNNINKNKDNYNLCNHQYKIHIDGC